NPIPTGGANFDGGSHIFGDAMTVTGSSAADSISINNTTITPASGPALTYVGVETHAINTAAGNDTLNFNGPVSGVTFNGGNGADTLNINSGTYTFNADARDATASLTVNV